GSRAMNTPSKVKDIIKNYYVNLKKLQETQIDIQSVVINIITDMRSGNTMSDNTPNEAIRRHDHTEAQKEMVTDIKYLQERTNLITCERNAQVLNLMMQGYTVTDISKITQQSRQNVYYRLDAIAKEICYPYAHLMI